MFHYIFIDPKIIAEAEHAGPMGMGRLIEFLRDMKTDCLLAETDLYRVETEIGEHARALQSQDNRNKIKALLESIWKSGPLLIMQGDCYDIDLVDYAMENGKRELLDLILTPGESDKPEDVTWERSNLTDLHLTSLSQTRTNLACGKNFAEDEIGYLELYKFCFSKLVRHAAEVCIYDYALGEYWGNAQPANFEWLVRFLRDYAPKLDILVIFTNEKFSRDVQDKINDLSEEVDFTIELKTEERNLPHNRYLGAQGRYLDTDRGVDLCRYNGRSRACQIKYASKPKC